MHQRVGEALPDRCFAPCHIEFPPSRASGDGGRVLDEAFGRFRVTVEEHVFDALEQRRLDVLVHGELPRIDDAHVEPGADRVVEERCVHRLSHRVVPAKREREVRDPAGDEGARAALLEERNRLDERLREAGVLLDPRGHRQHVRVEDDVLGTEPGLTDQEVVCPAEDLDLALDRLGLPTLVEGHDDNPRPVATDGPCLLEEGVLALLQRDGVDDALPLQALETRLERREPRAVDHDREPRRFRLRRDQVQERRHRLLGVEQIGVHVDVEQVRAAAHLLESDRYGALEVVRLDQLAELCGAGDVRPLSDDHEPRVRVDRERLQTGEARQPRRSRDVPRRKPRDGTRDLARVLRRRAATATDDVHEPVLGERT